MELFFSDDYVLGSGGDEIRQKPAVLAHLLSEHPVSGARVACPDPATDTELKMLHDAAYLDAIFSGSPSDLAESCGFEWDLDLVRAQRAMVGGARDAALAAWRDGRAASLSTGGHHAHSDRGSGYCMFNGVAQTALSFMDAGAERVIVVDFDAHCGGGTVDVLRAEPNVRQVDVSVVAFDSYDSSEQHSLWLVDDAATYLAAIERALAAIPTGWPDAIVYNAGVDPHHNDLVGGMEGITDLHLRLRDRMLFEWASGRGLPVAVLVAGGYSSFRQSPRSVAFLHRATLEEATRAA